MKKAILFLLYFTIMAFGAPASLVRGWNELVQCRKPEGNLRFVTPWGAKARPVVFMLHAKQGGRNIRVQLSHEGWEVDELLPDGRYTFVSPLSSYPRGDEGDEAEIVFKLREDEWSYYVNGELRGSMAAPFAMPGTVLWPQRAGVKLKSPMRYYAVARAAFKTDFMIEPGAPNELYPWAIQLGNWHIHTAQQQAVIRPETDQKRAQEAPLTADKSPNFYSLKGGGESKDAVITTGYDFYDNYSLSASLQLEEGEAGIVFYHRDSTVRNEQGELDVSKAQFYALTIRMDVPWNGNRDIRLWKQTGDGQRTVLARASVPLYNNQWHLPGIKVHNNEIICLLDEAELFRVREQLPPGGKIGLFANTKEQIRFDDITLEPFTAFDLDDMAGIRHNTLFHTGGFFKTEKKHARHEAEAGFSLYKKPAPVVLHAQAIRKEESLILGRAQNQGLCFSTVFAPSASPSGLVAGWTGPKAGYYRFAISERGEQLTSKLEKVAPDGTATVLDTYTLPKSNSLPTLTIDSTDNGNLRCFYNGLLLHYHENGAPIAGGSGIWLSPGANTMVTDLSLAKYRERILEQEQKNPVFKTDSFMRHWASPEGQWISGGGNKLWHKGDFFGDFTITLPVVTGSELHVAVPDGKEEGFVTVKAEENKLTLLVQQKEGEPLAQSVELDKIEGVKQPVAKYTLRHEGSWLWLNVEEKAVLKQRLESPLKPYGTHVLAKNMTLTHMASSKVTRANVLDEYFNESPHAWLANGGDWQIINRFQCTPSWSHMIGQATDNLGAFWLKKLFKGDMTLEFYAGTRHGHYDQAGNLNCTIMSKDTTPSSGYTVACTEWDQNLSQNWTTFYRNGKPLDKTDAYLVPRRRKGMYRRILNPLVSQGRPIHGAWFYIKLRKIGEKLEYYFDDELIFTQKDSDPIQEGTLGIWTFIHSITLAQIKITFDQMAPKPIPVTFLPLEDKAPKPPAPIDYDVYAEGFPVDACNSILWNYRDSVNQGTVLKGENAIGLKSGLGGGFMQLNATLAPIPLPKVAGWRFQVKRTALARFNFYYRLVTLNQEKKFVATRNLFHCISGDEFSENNWLMTGKTEVAPVEKVDLASDDGWQEITVWIPARIRRRYDKDTFVQVGGLGLEQTDAMVNGIAGNGPGETYAIRDLRPVFLGVPVLTGGGEVAIDGDFSADMTASNEKLKAASKEGLNTVTLALRKDGKTASRALTWIQAGPPEYTVDWDKTQEDTFILKPTADYFNPAFVGTQIQTASEKSIPKYGNDDSLTVVLPFTEAVQKELTAGKLSVKVKMGDNTQEFALDANAPTRLNGGPRLLAIDGITPFCLTFENGLAEPYRADKSGTRRSIGLNDATQGSFLSVQNTASGQTLRSSYSFPMPVSSYPVAQFRYRAWDMAYISMYFENGHTTRLTSSDHPSAVGVRHGTDFVMDEKWHTWTGLTSDSFTSSAYNTARFKPGALRLASVSSSDQTGRFSHLDLDDFTFGPAVSTNAQLAFTPKYYDADGVATIRAAILPGNASAYDTSADALDKLQWREYKPGEKITPEFPKDLQDGVSHVVFQATDAKGNRSHYMDVPFLLDRTPLACSYAIRASNEPEKNRTEMLITLNNQGGAPWSIDEAKFFIAGKQEQLIYWTDRFVHSQTADSLVLNHPLLFMSQLDASNDGDTMLFEIDNIKDGAGNTTPRFQATFKVDYKSDKVGPAWFYTTPCPSINWFFNWDGNKNTTTQLSPGQYNALDISRPLGGSPFLLHYSYYATADLVQSVKWNPNQFPCISFRAATSSPRNGMVIRLVLTAADKRAWNISLTTPGTAGDELNKTETFKWENGKWIRFSFNIKELLLKAGLTQEQLEKVEFTSINFQRRGLHHRDNIFLDDLFIHGMPADATKPDDFVWYAYDASGVASLEATAVNAEDKDEWTHSFTTLHHANLNDLRAKFKGQKWFRCHAKDKAGNLSAPFWLPLWSE